MQQQLFSLLSAIALVDCSKIAPQNLVFHMLLGKTFLWFAKFIQHSSF